MDPSIPPAYPMVAGSEMLVRRLQEKRASLETLRQLLLTQEVTVSESTLRKYCHEVLGKRPAAEVMPSWIGRSVRLCKVMRTHASTTPPAAEPVTPTTPESQVPPAGMGNTTPVASGGDYAASGERMRGRPIAQLRRNPTP